MLKLWIVWINLFDSGHLCLFLDLWPKNYSSKKVMATLLLSYGSSKLSGWLTEIWKDQGNTDISTRSQDMPPKEAFNKIRELGKD